MEKFAYVVLLPQYPTTKRYFVEADNAAVAAQKVRREHKDVRNEPYWACTTADNVEKAVNRLWEQYKRVHPIG